MDLTAMLKEWGVTVGLLSVAATALSVILVIALREFAHWFLGLNQILKNQTEILRRLENIENASGNAAIPAKPVVPEFDVSPVDLTKAAEPEIFRLQN